MQHQAQAPSIRLFKPIAVRKKWSADRISRWLFSSALMTCGGCVVSQLTTGNPIREDWAGGHFLPGLGDRSLPMTVHYPATETMNSGGWIRLNSLSCYAIAFFFCSKCNIITTWWRLILVKYFYLKNKNCATITIIQVNVDKAHLGY